MMASAAIQVRCRPESLREVRTTVDRLEQLPTGTVDATKIVANELVANSIMHSGLAADDPITVTIVTLSDRVRIDVRDEGRGFAFSTGRHEDGRGLAMAQALSSLLGICHNGTTHAWAEIEIA
jgi:two-component sensor histidine kinase